MKALRRILGPRAGRAAALALVAAFGASAASASEVVPAFLVKEVVSGRTDSIQIVLRTKLPFERVFLNPVDFSIDRKGMLNTEEPRDKRYSAKSWIRFRPIEMILLKGRDYPIDLPVLAPSGTPGGEFYAGVEITTVQKETPATKGMNVKVEVSMLALFVLRIKGGTPKVAGELVDPVVTVKDSTPHFSAVFHSLSTVAVVARAGVIVRGAD
ncbi:MAG TPA: hypothetical protein VJB14_16135, partial [Planctomycetota bacterium]|nr:hypothetical protein [Planctomycetota bacterium]